jgi:hypothetical protein
VWENVYSSAEFISTAIISTIGWVYMFANGRKNLSALVFRPILFSAILWLFLLTAHTALAASFTNANAPNEYLYYAQFSPQVRTVLDRIEHESENIPAGSDLIIICDTSSSWTFRWYLRNYPNVEYIGESLPADADKADVVLVDKTHWQRADQLLGGTYDRWEGIRIWWPNMDYMGLDGNRILFAFNDPAYREAIWDIWFYRDFLKYAQLTKEEIAPENWPASESVRVYTRR